MKEVIIYRVETKEGVGMYLSDAAQDAGMNNTGEKDGPHPHPKFDSGLEDDWWGDRLLGFGFKSLEQLKFWIYKREWKESLHNSGLHITKLKAQGIHGDTQAIFLPDTRVDIETISLLDV